jgi:hypothetical protein
MARLTVESRFEAMHATGLTDLVGREEEVDLLLRRWSKAKSGEGQVVLLSGEAGIGKSRLTAALLERLATEPHTRLRYFCSPQHTDSGGSSAYGWASPHGHVPAACRQHRRMSSAFRSRDCALQPCPASLACDAVWPRRPNGKLVPPIVGPLVAWSSRGRTQRCRPRAQGCTRD